MAAFFLVLEPTLVSDIHKFHLVMSVREVLM